MLVLREASGEDRPDMNRNGKALADFVDALQASGRYTFRREEARDELGGSEPAFRAAVRRLVEKRRLAVPRRGFFVVVPVEHRSAGVPPAPWFIDDLMAYLERPYYVGLLSAAALHGSAHQQPQEFQVVVGEPLRPSRVGRTRIRFVTKRNLAVTPVADIQTETGSMKVSTPEATALDLVMYCRLAGHLGNVATVLAEISEKLGGEELRRAAEAGAEMPSVQRLGHLLDLVGAEVLAEPLAALVVETKPRLVPLRPDRPRGRSRTDPRWRLVVNEKVAVDV
jgi:predicted transcriptional regulator of viral defense system